MTNIPLQAVLAAWRVSDEYATRDSTPPDWEPSMMLVKKMLEAAAPYMDTSEIPDSPICDDPTCNRADCTYFQALN